MARRVICISRLLGAGGGDVGRMAADSLGYRLVDEEIVQQAAESNGVSVEELADTERRTKVIERLTRNLAIAGGAAGLMTSGASPIDLSGGSDPKSLRALIQKSIHETAERGDVVIVSHAASYALAGRDDVLRVLVTASPGTRADRAAQEGSLDTKKAAKAVADGDADRSAYLKRFYNVGDELPTHYDLALNSDSMSIELMSELVVRAASAL
ncbi:MAG: cytidylate kinase-like family protein [Ilumatobacteraceae bacterium]